MLCLIVVVAIYSVSECATCVRVNDVIIFRLMILYDHPVLIALSFVLKV